MGGRLKETCDEVQVHLACPVRLGGLCTRSGSRLVIAIVCNLQTFDSIRPLCYCTYKLVVRSFCAPSNQVPPTTLILD